MLFDELADLLNQCVEPRAFFADDGRTPDKRQKSTVGVFHAHSCRAFATLDDHLDLAVLLFLRLENAAERADPVDLLGTGLVDGGVVLSSQENRPVCSQSLFERSHRACPTDFESDFGERENHDVADWNHRVPGYVGGGSV